MQELDHFQELAERSTPTHDDRESREVSARVVTETPPRRAWIATLEKVIETEVIPRLLVAHATRQPIAAKSRPRSPPTTDEFVRLLFGQEPDAGLAHIEALRADGVAVGALLLDHLAPAARRLGELWESDHCDFIEVSVGLRRLQFILQMLAPSHEETAVNRGPARRILLLPAPGESHAFGVAMAARFFLTDGWRVEQTTERDYLEALADQWFDVVGFSLSCDRFADNRGDAVDRARAASRNPTIPILVGGAAFSSNPDLAQIVGADAVARDAPHAVGLAQSLLNRQYAV